MVEEINEYKKVIFIDDDEDLVNVYSNILERKKLSKYLVHFNNAKDSIRYLENLKEEELPDYILLDLYMPEMNGFKFLEYVEKKLKKLSEVIEVYVCSSSRKKDDRYKAMKYPFVEAYLEKPLSSDFIEMLIKGYA